MTAPRLFCIHARDAPVAAVFARGPSDWWQVSRWWTAEDRIEPGAWFHGRLYPERGDLSPDGRYLFYFAVKGGPRPQWPEPTLGSMSKQLQSTIEYTAISRLPYLKALAAQAEIGTWFSSGVFVSPKEIQGAVRDTGPDGYMYTSGCEWRSSEGEIPAHEYARWRVRTGNRSDYTLECAHGWRTHPSDQAGPAQYWTTARETYELPWPNGRLQKPRPGGSARLLLFDNATTRHFLRNAQGRRVMYLLDRFDGKTQLIENAVWADWSHSGGLLVATNGGFIERRAFEGDALRTVWRHDLNGRTPDPQPAPEWAAQWADD